MTKYKILIWGAGSRAKTLLTMLSTNHGYFEYNGKKINNYKINYIVDSKKINNKFSKNIKFINKKKDFLKAIADSNSFIVTIGSSHGKIRSIISTKLKKLNLKPVSFFSKDFIKDKSVKIGEGCQIMKNVTINSNTIINNYCIFNTSSTIDHDCKIEEGCHLMPSSTLAGNVKLKKFTTIGSNATIIPNLTIEENSYVGAGSTIIKNIGKNQIIVGNSQRFLKFNSPKKPDLEFFK